MQKKSDLLLALQAYAKSGVYPFHMPGHKRNSALLGNALPYSLDITEIDGFDDLHAPNGILKELHTRLARLYRADAAFALVNGSTCGILAGIASVCRQGDSILLARNCHKSVYNAVELLGLRPVYIQPSLDPATGIAGSITPESVEAALETHGDIRLVVVTSPTYDGVISDVRSITQCAHKRNIPLLVDAAHGAHLAFTAQKANCAVAAGADIVILSLHKTLPALTQCAAACIGGGRVSPAVFAQKLSVFETSSPSYVLLASISACVRFLEENAETAFEAFYARLGKFSARCRALTHLSVLCKGQDTLGSHPAFFDFDAGKLPILTAHTDIDGIKLLERLRRDFSIEGEMAALSHALCMATVCDTDEGFFRLADALCAIDRTLQESSEAPSFQTPALPKIRLSPCDAVLHMGNSLPLRDCIGKVSAETVWFYPPGVPVLVAGEEIDRNTVQLLESAARHGIHVHSTKESGNSPDTLTVFD